MVYVASAKVGVVGRLNLSIAQPTVTIVEMKT
jgi:hypothetical protein